MKTKITYPISVHYFILRGPFGDMKAFPRIHHHDFTEEDNESEYMPLPLEDTNECNRLLAGKAINFRSESFTKYYKQYNEKILFKILLKYISEQGTLNIQFSSCF